MCVQTEACAQSAPGNITADEPLTYGRIPLDSSSRFKKCFLMQLFLALHLLVDLTGHTLALWARFCSLNAHDVEGMVLLGLSDGTHHYCRYLMLISGDIHEVGPFVLAEHIMWRILLLAIIQHLSGNFLQRFAVGKVIISALLLSLSYSIAFPVGTGSSSFPLLQFCSPHSSGC